MTRTCTVCNHKDVEEINKLLVAGESYRSIAKQFEASESAVYRHKESHISESLLKSKDIEDTVNANSLTRQIEDIREKIKSLLQKAEEADNLRDVHNFVGDTLRQIELEAKLQGQIQEQTINVNTVNLIQTPEWIQLKGMIITTLANDYPEALEALRHAIQ